MTTADNNASPPRDAASEGDADMFRAPANSKEYDDEPPQPLCRLIPASSEESETVRRLVELGKGAEYGARPQRGGDWRGTRGYGSRAGRGRNSVAPPACKRPWKGGSKTPRRPAKTNR